MSGSAKPAQVQTVNLTINGRMVEACAGQTILEAARNAGIEIPTLCHDPRLEPYGACRLCLVEVEGARGPMAACGTKITEGMKVETHTDKVVKLRKFVLELLLTNHPLDCPVCEAAGDCRLQDYAYEYLVDMVPWGWRPPQATDPGSHPNIAHFGTRCILCGRCVRICREVMSIGCWGYLNRGYETQVDTPYQRPLQEVGCVSCGQCVSTCPVGAITGQRAPLGAREWQTEKTKTTCSYCANGCSLVVHTYRDRIVRVKATLEEGLNKGNLCVKGRFGQGFADAPDRLLRPLVKGADGQLHEASWEEALAKIAAAAVPDKEKESGAGFAVLCGTHTTNEAAYLAQKLARQVMGSNNVAASDQAAKAAINAALSPMLGGASATNSRKDLAEAEAILVVGANLTESNPVFALTVIQAIRKDKLVIVIDPRRTELAKRARIHLAIKPGTDLLVLRAFLAHILRQNLVAKDFVDSHVQGFTALADSLKDVDIAAVATAAGVDEALLVQAATSFAQAASGAVVFGSGVTQSSEATTTIAALANIALLTGNIGRPGTGIYSLLGGANSQGLTDMGIAPHLLPGPTKSSDIQASARFDAAWETKLGELPTGHLLYEVLDGAERGTTSFLYVIGADPALECADRQKTLEQLGRVPFLLVQDSYLTDTARLADVVLPAAASTEDEGTFTNVERVVQRVRAAAPPKGDSRPDWEIIQAVAKALGAQWSFKHPADIMDEIAGLVDGYAGVTYPHLDEGGVTVPCSPNTDGGEDILYQHDFTGTLSPVAAPSWSEASAEVPYLLITGTVLEHHESGARSRRAPGLISLNSEAVLEINPADAGRLGVVDQGQVRVSSATGAAVEAKAKVTTRVPEGVVFLPGFDPGVPLNQLLERSAQMPVAVQVQAM